MKKLLNLRPVSEDPGVYSRRMALGLLATGAAATLVGCGGAGEDNPGAAGSAGSAGTGGSAGMPGTGGTAGTAGAAGSGGTAGAAGSTSSLMCHQTGPTPGCLVTDDNILGPYYKAGAPIKADLAADVTVGQVLVISGHVLGCDCMTPLAGAEVDVWQADDAGVYDNAGYTLRGKVVTDADGYYEITTILPGWYLNGATYRPRHVHYKVSHMDGTALTTQLYFEGDPYIPTDPYVKPSLIMPLTQDTSGGTVVNRCTFDIVLA